MDHSWNIYKPVGPTDEPMMEEAELRGGTGLREMLTGFLFSGQEKKGTRAWVRSQRQKCREKKRCSLEDQFTWRMPTTENSGKEEAEEADAGEVEELGRFPGMEARGSFKKMVPLSNATDS